MNTIFRTSGWHRKLHSVVLKERVLVGTGFHRASPVCVKNPPWKRRWKTSFRKVLPGKYGETAWSLSGECTGLIGLRLPSPANGPRHRGVRVIKGTQNSMEMATARKDKWGVELGKLSAQRIIPELESKTETKLEHHGSTNNLIHYCHDLRGLSNDTWI
jgi:hypothetical protein